MEKKEYNFHEDFKNLKNFKPPLNRICLPIFQVMMRAIIKTQKSDKNCEMLQLLIPLGKKNINALLYNPIGLEKPSPLLIYFHGGGFVLPAAKHHYDYARFYAINTPCKVLLVDYPLAPKYKYPMITNASFSCFKWVVENAALLNIDTSRIVVGGDSAGGNISSIVCLMASDEKLKIKPCAQMLIYPAVGTKTPTKSMKEFTDTPMCNSKDYKKYIKYYFKNKKDMESRYSSPLYIESMKIYPKTYIETAEYDCFRDEALLYADELKESGVPVIAYKTKGTMHAYDMVQDSKITQRSLNKRADFLKSVFYHKK